MTKTIAAIVLALVTGCAGAALDNDQEPASCERSAYELERTRYRCTAEGALETLDCGSWVELQLCNTTQSCSPGPDPGCR